MQLLDNFTILIIKRIYLLNICIYIYVYLCVCVYTYKYICIDIA